MVCVFCLSAVTLGLLFATPSSNIWTSIKAHGCIPVLIISTWLTLLLPGSEIARILQMLGSWSHERHRLLDRSSTFQLDRSSTCHAVSCSVSCPKRLNVSKLKDPTIQRQLVESIDNFSNSDSANAWSDFKLKLNDNHHHHHRLIYWCSFNTTDKVEEDISFNLLGFDERKHQDWFDNDEEIIALHINEL